MNIIKDIPTLEELNRILFISKQERFASYILFRLLAVTGRRLGEFIGIYKNNNWDLGMTANDIYPDDNKIMLFVIKVKRTSKGKPIQYKYDKQPNFIPPDLMDELMSFVKENNLQPSDYVFRGNHVPSYRTFQRDFTKFRDLAGTKRHNITIHSLRHYLVTLLRVEMNMPYEAIAERFTKHRSIDVMKRSYTHLEIEKQKDEIMKDLKHIEGKNV